MAWLRWNIKIPWFPGVYIHKHSAHLETLCNISYQDVKLIIVIHFINTATLQLDTSCCASKKFKVWETYLVYTLLWKPSCKPCIRLMASQNYYGCPSDLSRSHEILMNCPSHYIYFMGFSQQYWKSWAMKYLLTIHFFRFHWIFTAV